MVRGFRFMAPMPEPAPLPRWRQQVQRIEQLGFDSVRVVDHFTEASALEPITAMTAAVAVTERLRVVSLVMCNDYRHPVMTHRMAAFIDVLSEGRLELGLGAGWLRSDYDAAGMVYDPPQVRVSRLIEAVGLIKGLFGDEAVNHEGAHYRITGLHGKPAPAQRPHPRLLIGGGGPRVLAFAAREADIVGLNANLRAGVVNRDIAVDLGADPMTEKVTWVREAAARAGRSMDDIELQLTCFVTAVTPDMAAARARLEAFAEFFDVPVENVAQSPSVLVGTIEYCVERLLALRERYGFSYVDLRADPETTAPIVEQLSGR